MSSNLSPYFSRSKKNFTLDIIDELKKELQFKYNKIESTLWPTVSADTQTFSYVFNNYDTILIILLSVSKSGEVDIHIEIDGTSFIILCKDWTRDI
ncbi:16278_t:CDS:2, partial [Gigaspora margarita]